MEKCRRFVFYNNIDSFWRPFAVKFIGENRSKEKEENKLRHNQVISMACTLISMALDQSVLEKSLCYCKIIVYF